MTNGEIIGANIRKHRIAEGWSQEALAGELGMNPSHLRTLEKGASNPTLSTLERIADMLGIEVSVLFEGANASDDSQ